MRPSLVVCHPLKRAMPHMMSMVACGAAGNSSLARLRLQVAHLTLQTVNKQLFFQANSWPLTTWPLLAVAC